jgi:hypothetical protein
MFQILMAVLLTQEQDRAFDLQRHDWLKWKPGAYSMHKLTFSGMPDPPPSMTLTRRLESVRQKDYSLSETRYSLGFADRDDLPTGVPRFLRHEALDFPSGPRASTVWEWESGLKGKLNKAQYWLSADDKPLQTRWIHSQDGVEAWRQDVKAVAFDEEVQVAGKPLRCVRLEGTFTVEGRALSVVEWWTPDVPGGTIRGEMTFEKGPPLQKVTMEVVSFGESDPAQPPPGPPRKIGDLTLTPGMALDQALDLLEASGAWEFQCGYARGYSPARPRPFLVNQYFTLRNGLTLRFDADKEPWLSAVRGRSDWPPHYALEVDCPACKTAKNKPCPEPAAAPHDERVEAARGAGFPKDDPAQKRKILSLEVCDSTLLLCCKGETWIPVDSIELKKERVALSPLPATAILKGMTSKEAAEAAEKAKAAPLETDAAWLKVMPKQGRWLRFALAGKVELILNIGPDDLVSLLVLQDGEGNRVEAELVDLAKPLGERGFGFFGESWSWKPDRPPQEAERLKRAGHRR